MLEQLRECVYCHNDYAVGRIWTNVTCQECAKKLNSELSEILFKEILGYEGAEITAFLPELPNDLFKPAYSSVVREHHIS
ncbi:hypothetical protein ACT9XH_00695 [Methanococcoides methylutens]|uniref:hypothetical protein n=1 Tax=Methanococcoides methylutens TaxID=2226 RepID=UPI00404417AA